MTDFEMLELALDGAIHKLQAACKSAASEDFRWGIPRSLVDALEDYKEVKEAHYWANFDRVEKEALEKGDLETVEEIRRTKELRKKERLDVETYEGQAAACAEEMLLKGCRIVSSDKEANGT